MILRALLFASLLSLCAFPVHAANHYLILSGSGGEEQYDANFSGRAERLKSALITKAETPESAISLLSAQSKDQPLTLELLQAEIESLSKKLGAEHDLIIVLIGHGSQIRNESKFQIPGPDLEAAAFGELLKTIPARRIAIINTTASSAGFINSLSAPGRLICTATKSAGERNATMFSEHLVVALEEGSADQNRDERISLSEWLQQADALTQAYYTGEGLIASEHALMDDNSDGLGMRLSELAGEKPDAGKDDQPASDMRQDGEMARTFFIRDFDFPEHAPKEVTEKYLGLLRKVEELKSKKSAMAAADYARELEKLLTDAAKLHREIRGYATKNS